MNATLITGGSGFVGKRLVLGLSEHSQHVVLLSRSPSESAKYKTFRINGFSDQEDFSQALVNVENVVHCAARVHVLDEPSADALDEFRVVNVAGTMKLAYQAAEAGVKRFIYISSVKVNGESTSHSLPFREADSANPSDPYGISKCEAEEALLELAKHSNMEVVIIRPPLVYGPGVKANFFSLMKLAATGLPLPFASINNKRSMVYVDNLIDFIIRCIDHPNAANEVFLISDNDDISLSNLLSMMRAGLGVPKRLLPIPSFLFKLAGKLTGKQAVVDRLVGDLQVDVSKAVSLLDWTPPYTVKEGIAATVADFIKRKN